MNQFLCRAHKQIETLTPYQAGQSIQSLKHLSVDSIIKLASNENPLGASPKAKAAIATELDDVFLYPEFMTDTLAKLASHWGLQPSQCILGCGSENVIAMLLQVFNRPDNHCLIPQYAFSAYRINAKALNVNTKIINPIELKLNIEQILNQITAKTSLVFIDNPNNPTGHYFNHDEISYLLEKMPTTTLLVLDEAYYEYARLKADYPNALALLKRHSNLVILRTFSKIYGLAGLRVGYGMACQEIISLLNRVRFPFNVNSLGLAAARGALNDDEFVKQSLELNQKGLLAYQTCFDNLGLNYIDSIANFITLHLNHDGKQLFEYLLNQGIITRPLHAYGLDNYLRISIGSIEQNQRAIEAIQTYPYLKGA